MEELYGASEIPLVVAEKCLLLAEHAITVFEVGFKAARGDSEVAIDSALSGTTGAVSIVYLNLSSFRGQPQARELLGRAEELEERANLLRAELQAKILELKDAARASNDGFGLDINVIRDPRRTDSKYSEADIEAIARNVQNELWVGQEHLWPDGKARSPLEVLDPPSAFRALGYEFDTPPFLGQILDGGSVTEVAGYINKPERYAAVSRQFPPVVQRFTAAHELGHAVLHRADEQFRDRGLDGSLLRGPRPQVEYEADKFAAYFLMPESSMREAFVGYFGTDRLVVSDDTAFALGAQDSVLLLKECPTTRELSLRLARAAVYAGNHMKPLANLFGVSYEAMAIRIEELRMIDPGRHRLLPSRS